MSVNVKRSFGCSGTIQSCIARIALSVELRENPHASNASVASPHYSGRYHRYRQSAGGLRRHQH
eukprot:UN09802